MAGTQTKKIPRFYVHLTTVMLFVFSPFFYYNFIMRLLEGENTFIVEHLERTIIFLLMPAIFACIVKVMMLFKW